MNEKIRVVGIDPAPGKKSCVYDPDRVLGGGADFSMYEQERLYNKIKTLKEEAKQNVLICWDAPLTAKRDLETDAVEKGDLTMRDIEKYFRAEVKAVKGISVLPYCGAPYWTFSQYCLGLPQVGGAMRGVEPLLPLAQSSELDETSVVEVHPAVALYYWLKETPYGERLSSQKSGWSYKRKNKVSQRHWKKLRTELKALHAGLDLPKSIANDDQLDALVAWILGTLWCLNKDIVSIAGTIKTGAWLLPASTAKMYNQRLPSYVDKASQP